jgi:hypothetical protein
MALGLWMTPMTVETRMRKRTKMKRMGVEYLEIYRCVCYIFFSLSLSLQFVLNLFLPEFLLLCLQHSKDQPRQR